jgi:transposase
MSKMAAHKTFRISRSTIDDWLALRTVQGHVHPKAPAQRGPHPAIADLEAFKAFAHDHNGCTLAQMAHAWEQATGRRLSRNTFSLALTKIGWTRKKSALPTPSATRFNEQRFGSR